MLSSKEHEDGGPTEVPGPDSVPGRATKSEAELRPVVAGGTGVVRIVYLALCILFAVLTAVGFATGKPYQACLVTGLLAVCQLQLHLQARVIQQQREAIEQAIVRAQSIQSDIQRLENIIKSL